MHQWRHPLPADHARSFGRIIERDERVVIAAMGLGKVLGADVSGERSDVPGTDAEDVGHGNSGQWWHGLDR